MDQSTDPGSLYRSVERAESVTRAQARSRRRSRRRRALVIVPVVVLVLAAGGLVAWAFTRGDPYGCRSSTSVPITLPAGSAPRTYPSPSAAVNAFVTSNPPQLNREPVPADEWREHDGWWIRDASGGSFYRVGVKQLGQGWLVSDSFSLCHP
jgi:hypothetical protein